jgi:hypothetical protein
MTPKKRLFYTLTLFVTPLVLWAYVFKLVHSDYDNSKEPVTIPYHSVYLRSKQYLSPGDYERIRFELVNQGGDPHTLSVTLDELGKGRVNVVGNQVVFDGQLPGRGEASRTLAVKLPFDYANFGAPQVVGLGLEGKVDSDSFERRRLQLYTSPLPKVTLLERYFRIAAGGMGFILFGFLCLWTREAFRA